MGETALLTNDQTNAPVEVRNNVTPLFPKWFDAKEIGDLNAESAQAVINLPAHWGQTGTAPYVNGEKWFKKEGCWGDLIDLLSTHPEQIDKGGKAFFFANGKRTGQDRTTLEPLCSKLKADLTHVYAAAIDVDGGGSFEAAQNLIREAGLFAVLYTSFSSTLKGGPGNERFRIILPLSEPFDLGEGDERPARETDWEARLAGLYTLIIPPDADLDARSFLPTQLMYAPARPKGAAFKHVIIAGEALDLSQIAPGNPRKWGKSSLIRKPGTSRRKASGAVREESEWGEAYGFDEHIALIGDDQDGFHMPIYRAACSWFYADPEGEPEALKAELLADGFGQIAGGGGDRFQTAQISECRLIPSVAIERVSHAQGFPNGGLSIVQAQRPALRAGIASGALRFPVLFGPRLYRVARMAGLYNGEQGRTDVGLAGRVPVRACDPRLLSVWQGKPQRSEEAVCRKRYLTGSEPGACRAVRGDQSGALDNLGRLRISRE